MGLTVKLDSILRSLPPSDMMAGCTARNHAAIASRMSRRVKCAVARDSVEASTVLASVDDAYPKSKEFDSMTVACVVSDNTVSRIEERLEVEDASLGVSMSKQEGV